MVACRRAHIAPGASQNGADPQLAKAIEVIMQDMAKQPAKAQGIPAQYPLRGRE